MAESSTVPTRIEVLATHLRTTAGAAPCAHPRAKELGGSFDAALAAYTKKGNAAVREMEKLIASPAPVPGQRPLPRRNPWERLHEFEDATVGLEYDIAKHLPGPLRAHPRDEVLREALEAAQAGAQHMLWEEWQRRHCGGRMSSNFVMPVIMVAPGKKPVRTQQIILAHPGDCMRIARDHVKKQPNFSVGLLGTGIISTTDNAHWKQQRESLVNAFHPMASLAKIFSLTVVQRAEKCAGRLADLARGGAPVDIGGFMLHETLAQLMLGLFGFPEEFMDKTNERFRDVMSGKVQDRRFPPFFVQSLLEMMKSPLHTTPSEGLLGSPLHGPLSRLIETTTPANDTMTKVGNASIFAFAGHDTTGHTLTWLIFELCRNPGIQRRLQKEVDDFFAMLGGRRMEYRDLAQLQFMTRCVMETLRLWNAVPNGTFREFQHDDWVHGDGGARVRVPKGTYVQVTTWLRHRDPELWGPDAGVFNPDREFRGSELWDGRGFAAYNPASERFSPFTFQPRDCIGKNFAQSEMRAILCYILRRFSFELVDPERAGQVRGVNYGTMGPKDTSRPEPVGPQQRVLTGLLVRAVPRGA